MGKIIIRRQPLDYRFAEVDTAELRNAHWSNTCGGLQSRQLVISIYAYMDYKRVVDCGVAISGSHDFGYNEAKVCINKKDNVGKKTSETDYYQFVVEADHNKSSIYLDRKKTKVVTDYLRENINVCRYQIKADFVDKGYDGRIINEAIRILYKAGYLEISGSITGKNSKISLSKAFPY